MSEPARTARGGGVPASERVGGFAGAEPPDMELDELKVFLAVADSREQSLSRDRIPYLYSGSV